MASGIGCCTGGCWPSRVQEPPPQSRRPPSLTFSFSGSASLACSCRRISAMVLGPFRSALDEKPWWDSRSSKSLSDTLGFWPGREWRLGHGHGWGPAHGLATVRGCRTLRTSLTGGRRQAPGAHGPQPADLSPAQPPLGAKDGRVRHLRGSTHMWHPRDKHGRSPRPQTRVHPREPRRANTDRASLDTCPGQAVRWTDGQDGAVDIPRPGDRTHRSWGPGPLSPLGRQSRSRWQHS